MKKIRGSIRGLTFSLDDVKKIGTKFRYIIDKENSEIIIIPDKDGRGTVSRKKSGKHFKALYDIRSKAVKDIVSSSDYLEVEEQGDKIIVHTYQAVKQEKIILFPKQKVKETGHIILQKASGEYLPQYSFGKPTLWNDAYFDSLVRSYPGQHFKKKELQTVFSVVSLFSGAGLLDYAFKDPQFRFVYGVDFDEDACATYRKNIGEHIVCKDIRNVSSKEVPDCDVIIGGPCCQAYSNANRTNINTKKSEQKRLLIEDFVRIVKEKTPKIFVIENVPQMLTKDNGKYIKKIYDNLSEYEITSTVVSDAAVGGYTLRKRAIIIGSKIGKIELPSHEVHTLHTVNEALSKVDDTWFNQSDVTLPRENTKLCMSYVPQGGNWKNIPESIHKFGPSTQSNTYRRLSLTGLSPTLTNWRKCILIHPTKNRILTVSEAAALMGLDKKFHVLGRTLNSKQQQIGNGVTQAIGRFVKKHILNALNKTSNVIKFA
jgi:DNA (cytosine-5)-methyltransferase 1